MLQTFIAAEQSSTRATQTILLKQSTLLDKQLKEITKLSYSRKVPQSHFESNSADGISFDISQPTSQDPTTKQEHSNHPPAPPTSAAQPAPSNSADDSSVISIQSAIHQPGYHDTKLNVESFKAKWLKEGAPAKIWLSQIIGELASKPYYHPLLTECKTKINYDATGDGPNATLFSVLHNKLSESYRIMLCLNCNFTTGTQILHFIEHATKKLGGNKSNETRNISDFYRAVWSPSDEDLDDFNARFNTLYNSVLETNPNFNFDSVKDTWIRAMPAEFTDLKTKYQKSNLDSDWENADNIASLYIQTHAEMTNCSISFDKPKQTKETTQQDRKAPTLSEVRRVSADKRSEFPPAFPTATKVEEEIRRMIADGKTKADVEAKFKADYDHKSCYCCRIKPYQKQSHKPYGPYGCPILKSLFTSYSTSSSISSSSCSSINSLVGQTRSAKPKKKKSNRTRTKQVPSSTTPIRMCYDTGTSPKSICSKREYFRELVLFESPKFIALAEQDSLAEVIGQGMLDIIINNSYRMWIFAYLTAKSDTLLSAVDHLSYSSCTIAGAHGKIKISYPTFNYEVSGSENFEFNILPGKSSNKPVLWKPNPEA